MTAPTGTVDAPVGSARFGRPRHVSSLAWFGGTALAFVAIVVMIALATWQYSRAKPHVDGAVLAASRAQAAVPAAEVLDGATELEPTMVGRRVTLGGRYLPGRTWVAARESDAGSPGFVVLAGFAPDRDSDRMPASVLVARGWTSDPRVARRATPPAGRTEITGWIATPEVVSSEIVTPGSGADLAEVSPVRVASRLPAPILDGYVGLLTPDGRGLQPAPEPVLPAHGSWSILNLGYALQWLLFAAGTMLAWMLHVREARQKELRLADSRPAVPEPTVPRPDDQPRGDGA